MRGGVVKVDQTQGQPWLARFGCPNRGRAIFFAQRGERARGVLLVNRYSSVGVGSSWFVPGGVTGDPS